VVVGNVGGLQQTDTTKGPGSGKKSRQGPGRPADRNLALLLKLRVTPLRIVALHKDPLKPMEDTIECLAEGSQNLPGMITM